VIGAALTTKRGDGIVDSLAFAIVVVQPPGERMPWEELEGRLASIGILGEEGHSVGSRIGRERDRRSGQPNRGRRL
jgi:hypothetical protein